MGKWDGIKNPKILAAVSGDKQLSHSDVVDLIHDALGDARLTADELSDFWIVAKNSDGMAVWSIALLWYLVEQARKAAAADGIFNLTTAGERVAADRICDFMKGTGNGYFPNLNRDKVGVDLLMRVGNPGVMDQDRAGLCGPFAFIYGLASDKPLTYADYAIDLYEKGKASIGNIDVSPSRNCRNASLPSSMSPADWLTVASLRDSTNLWFDVDHDEDSFWNNAAAGASVSDIKDWFKKSGYVDIKSEDNMLYNLDSSDIDDLNRYYNEGRRIILAINAAMLMADKQTETTHKANHIVGLTSPIARTPQGIQLTVFTWGRGKYMIPQGPPLKEKDFLDKLYGYVAGKPY